MSEDIDYTVAQRLLQAGVPLFVAHPDDTKPLGFALPSGWQNTQPGDDSALREWRPESALCAIMGHGLDLIDIDPRHGGSAEALEGYWPYIHAVAATPSGGVHAFITSLNRRSLNGLRQGVDYKGGNPEIGKGWGFAFIPPTVRKSKLNGELTPYQWVKPFEPTEMNWPPTLDTSGAALAGLIDEEHRSSAQGPDTDPDSFMHLGPWEDVRGTLAAGRNDGVHKLAAALRGRGGWNFDGALAYMRQEVWPLIDQGQGDHAFTEDEFVTAIRGVWDRYEDGASARIAEAMDTSSERVPLTGVGLTESYLSDRVVTQALANRFVWTPELGWLEWDGRRWLRITDNPPFNAVREYLVYLHARESQAGAEEGVLKKLVQFLSYQRINAIYRLCKSHPSLNQTVKNFDTQPHLLNCQNGVVDLRTGELLPHDPRLWMTKLAPTSYRAGAVNSDWTKALEAVPEDVREWYQVRMGQAITGYTPDDDVLLVQTGIGSNGKSTLMYALRAAVGSEYCVTVNDRALVTASAYVHPTERMVFLGARLTVLEETAEGGRMPSNQLKKIIGTQVITARYINRDQVEFEASHSMVLSTNHPPQLDESDHGTWRRLLLLDMPFRFVPSESDIESDTDRVGVPGLHHRIGQGDEQREAVLAWLVEGARTWLSSDRMPDPPKRVREATKAWQRDCDPLYEYVSERLTLDPRYHVLTQELTEDFGEWLAARGQRAWSSKLITQRIRAHAALSGQVREGRARRDQSETAKGGIRSGREVSSAGFPVTPRSVPEQYRAFYGLKWSHLANDRSKSQEGNGDTRYGSYPYVTEKPADQQKPGFGTEGTALVVASNIELSSPIWVSNPLSKGPTTKAVPSVPMSTEDGSGDEANLVTESEPKPNKANKPTKPKKQVTQQPPDPEILGRMYTLPVRVAATGEIEELDPESVRTQLSGMLSLTNGHLYVDVETTGYPIGHQHYGLRTVQLGDRHDAYVLDAQQPGAQETVREALALARYLHAFSATADLHPLAYDGLGEWDDLWDRMWDVAIKAKLADPHLTDNEAGLKGISGALLRDAAQTPYWEDRREQVFASATPQWLSSTKLDTPVERSGWAQIPSNCEVMIRYAASDVLDLAEIDRRLPDPPDNVMERERAIEKMCARLNYFGLPYDREWTESMRAEHLEARERTQDEATSIWGIRNLGSTKQVAEVFERISHPLPRTAPSKTAPEGNPSTKDSVLQKILFEYDGTPAAELAQQVLTYRHHKTALSSFLDKDILTMDTGDGRVRPTIYTLGTDTGRMSSVRPNIQQRTKKGGFRGCIRAEDGYVIISADFSSVEVRVMAALSGDGNLKGMIERGEDLYWMIARQVFGMGADDGHRSRMKIVVLGRFYGGGLTTLSDQAGIPEHTTKAALDTLDALTPQLSQWSSMMREAARQGRTHFPTYSGRIIHLPSGRPHAAPNYGIQGTARELLVDGMLEWRKTRFGDSLVIPFHDEVIAMVRAEDAEEATRTLVECMTMDLFGVRIEPEAAEYDVRWLDG